MSEYYRRFFPVWPGQRTGRYLGSGSFGDVWELIDDEHPEKHREVVKEVLIPPESAGGLDEARLQGLDYRGAMIFFEEMKQRALDEVELMTKLSACPCIVHVSGCEVRELDETAGEIGWVAFIRMEYLQPFRDKLIQEGITVPELIRLGIDICTALEACGEQGIIHRDIKPENLLFDPESERFKLGDFGISCYLSRPTVGKGLPGTLTHMSPQVYRGEAFTPADDLYALGMILYKLLNDNRIPFLPAYPVPFSPEDRDRALDIRLKGTPVPLPSILSAPPGSPHPTIKPEFILSVDHAALEKLGQIAARSISPDPAERFPAAADLREALEELNIE